MGLLKIFYGLKTTPSHIVNERGDARDYIYSFFSNRNDLNVCFDLIEIFLNMPPSGPDLAWGGWEENPEESRDNFF